MQLLFSLLPGEYAVGQLAQPADLTELLAETTQIKEQAEFVSLSLAPDEVSLVCPARLMPPAAQAIEAGWRVLRIAGPLDFSLVGIVAGIGQLLARAGISIFVVSTYNTDYILVKKEKLHHSVQLLREANHQVVGLGVGSNNWA